LLLACLAASRDPSLLPLAEAAAYDVWDGVAASASLCCGMIGRAYGLLSFFRLTGDETWHQRAIGLAETAAHLGGFGQAPSHSLFKGELALAVLASDLAHPMASAFPLLETEGWPPQEV
jgi:hypothetical protein